MPETNVHMDVMYELLDPHGRPGPDRASTYLFGTLGAALAVKHSLAAEGHARGGVRAVRVHRPTTGAAR